MLCSPPSTYTRKRDFFFALASGHSSKLTHLTLFARGYEEEKMMHQEEEQEQEERLTKTPAAVDKKKRKEREKEREKNNKSVVSESHFPISYEIIIPFFLTPHI